MFSDSGSRRAANIHAEVEAVGFVDFAQGGLTVLGEVRHFVGGGLGCRVEFTEVRVRRNHQVTTDIGIAIQNDEIAVAAKQDEVLRIIGRSLESQTEDAVRGRHFGSGGGDVCVPPGAPKSIHRGQLS